MPLLHHGASHVQLLSPEVRYILLRQIPRVFWV